jgi:translation initiation factor 1
MGRQKRGKERIDVSGAGSSSLGSALADALRAQGIVASSADEPKAKEESPAVVAGSQPKESLTALLARCGKLWARKERKGRKGKTVTLLGDLSPLTADERRQVARELGKAFGCGASVEETTVILQGDHQQTLRARYQSI